MSAEAGFVVVVEADPYRSQAPTRVSFRPSILISGSMDVYDNSDVLFYGTESILEL